MSCSFLFPSSDIRTRKERARSEGNSAVAFKSCNALIRQLTHGLGGDITLIGRSHSRVTKQKAARELSRAAFETNCRVPPSSIRHQINNE